MSVVPYRGLASRAIRACAELTAHARRVSPIAVALGVSILNGLAIAVVYGRVAGSAAYGVYQIALAGLGLAAIVSWSGSGNAAMRAAAQGRAAAWPLFRYRLPYCALGAVALAAAAGVVAATGNGGLAAAFVAAAVTMPLSIGGDVFPAHLLGARRYGAYLRYQLAVQVLIGAAVIAAIVLRPDEPWLAVLAMTGVSGVWQFRGLLGVRAASEVAPTDVSYAKRVTGIGLLTVVVSRIDVLVVGWMLGASEAGLVAVARKFSNAVRSLWVGVVQPPVFARLAADARQEAVSVMYAYRFLIAAVFTAISALGILATPFAIRIFGSEFTDATVLAQLLFGAAAVSAFGYVGQTLLRAQGLIGWEAVTYAGSSFVLLATMPALVLLWGIDGIGIAALASSGVFVLLVEFFLVRLRRTVSPSPG